MVVNHSSMHQLNYQEKKKVEDKPWYTITKIADATN